MISKVSKTVSLYILHLIAFCMPLSAKVSSVLIILFFIATVVDKDTYRKINFNKFTFLFISLYLFSVISIINSTLLDRAFFDLQLKTGILLFPLLLLNSELKTKENVAAILKSNLDGCITACLLCFTIAGYKYFYTKDIGTFFYGEFSALMHPSYFAMNICFAFALVCRNILVSIKNKSTEPLKNYAIALLLLLTIILSSSKSGIIAVIITISICIFYLVFKYKKHILGLSLLVLISCGGLVILKTNNPVSLRVKALVTTLITASNNKSVNEEEGSANRLLVWKTSWSILKTHLLGVGTGDVHNTLIEEYKKRDMVTATKKQLNCHNQYLQTGLGLGYIGFALLFLILAIPMYVCKHNTTYLIFLLLIAGNFLVESILETQTGVFFYAFFNSLLFGVNNVVDKQSIQSI